MQDFSIDQSHWELAYKVAMKIVRAPDQAEDIAQETIIKAHLALEKFDGRSKPESWIYRIAHNTAISHLRKPFRRRYSAMDVNDAVERHSQQNSTPEENVYVMELAEAVSSQLNDLCANDREAFVERFVIGRSEKELGKKLGISPNAAKQRAFRARRILRQQWNEAA